MTRRELYNAVVRLLQDRVAQSVSKGDVEYWGALLMRVGKEEGENFHGEHERLMEKVKS